MNIVGIPDSITEAQLQDLIRSLGIDVDNVTREGVQLGWDAITCTVYALNGDGHRYVDTTNDAAAVHHVSIPVIHPERDAR